MHHLISDATSRTIINSELEACFNGDLDDSLDLGFLYDADKSFTNKFKPSYDEAYGFFMDQFSEIDTVVGLMDDVDGEYGSVTLPVRGIRDKVESFVQSKSITVGVLLDAVFAYTYSRFTGNSKIYFTFTEHGRHDSYNEKALGMYVRTIPVIVDCVDVSVEEYIGNVSDVVLNSILYSDYSFRFLARDFDLINDVSFEYNFNLNDVSRVGDDLICSEDTLGLVSSWQCVVNDLDDGFVVSISHDDKYSQSTAIRFVKAFANILNEIIEKESLSDINYTIEEDINLMNKINDTDAEITYNNILPAFNDSLSKYLDCKLVEYEDVSYTYGEGAFIIDKIAKSLVDNNVSHGDFVAIFVERSHWYLLAALGVLSVGAVYVPIDDNLPDERIRFIVKDTGLKNIIVSESTFKYANTLFEDLDLNIVNVSDIEEEDIGVLEELSLEFNFNDDDLACVLYTSGTTGTPKGVLIPHKAISNLAEYYIKNTEFNSTDVYGMYASFGFDVSILAMFSSIWAGACLNIVPEDVKLDMVALNEHFIKYGVTHTMITTQVGKLFMETIKDSSLDLLLVGGEKLGKVFSPENYDLFDIYGPTECCAFISGGLYNTKCDESSIGYLNDNIKAYVLDCEGRRVPYGAVGELYLSGYQLALGYLNREDEEKTAFLNNLFDGELKGYEYLYRTGDLVRYLPDGSLGFIGRRDSQVKVRGNRVELSEVESVIRELDFINDVTVQTIKHDDNNELVAYIVVDEDIGDVRDKVIDYVGVNKPDFMVPSYIVVLDSIPLNVNGKVDRKALPDVEVSSAREYVAPSNKIEEIIVNVFEDVLGQESIGIHDDFLHLGGDSIKAIRVISSLQDKGLSCSAQDILTYHTPYLIAQNISYNKVIESYDIVEGEVDLLPIQEFFFNEINSNKFTQSFIVKAKSDIDLDILQESFDKLTDVHDMLRVIYHESVSGVVQGKSGNGVAIAVEITCVHLFRCAYRCPCASGIDVGCQLGADVGSPLVIHLTGEP